jgi:rare lipoprotein A
MRPFRIFLVLVGWVLLLVAIGTVASHAETMVASYYGAESGHRTASGERFNPQGMTAAHKTLPFGTRLRVCRGGRCVSVRVTDRGPFVADRQLDLSSGAVRVIELTAVGVGRVEVTRE